MCDLGAIDEIPSKSNQISPMIWHMPIFLLASGQLGSAFLLSFSQMFKSYKSYGPTSVTL